jgi:hypothetical protein
MCIEAYTDEGRETMLKKKAQHIFKAIPSKPRAYGVWEIAPDQSVKNVEGIPDGEVSERTVPLKWLVAGPVPFAAESQAAAVYAALAKARPVKGSDVTAGGSMYRFRALPDDLVSSGGIDIARACDGAEGSAVAFYTVLYSDGERLLRIEMRGDTGVKVWFAGQWIRNNNTVRIRRGYYPVMVHARIGSAGEGSGTPRFLLAFEESEAFRKWKPLLRRFREPLEEIVRDLPGSDEAQTAAAMLAASVETE